MTAASSPAERSRFVQYLFLRLDPAWRRLPQADRDRDRSDFAAAARSPSVALHAYSTLGLKAGTDLMLWHSADDATIVQEHVARLLRSGVGRYLEISGVLFGITRPSLYTKKRTDQDDALNAPDRLPYLIVYPFVKTVEWYLMSREARQGMMNEHMRIGHEYADVRQVLLYTTGLDDQEFVVAYETTNLERHHQLVVDLRATEARRYTARDTPIHTAIHHPLERALALLG